MFFCTARNKLCQPRKRKREQRETPACIIMIFQHPHTPMSELRCSPPCNLLNPAHKCSAGHLFVLTTTRTSHPGEQKCTKTGIFQGFTEHRMVSTQHPYRNTRIKRHKSGGVIIFPTSIRICINYSREASLRLLPENHPLIHHKIEDA